MQTLFIGLTLLASYCNGLIVPQELPSVLSLIYSNIPPVLKGTDSRFGFGFRLGEHADFQVTFELGPQKYTKQAKDSSDDADSSDTSKRMVDQSDYNTKIPPPSPVVSGNNYLNRWANDMKTKTIQNTRKPQASAENESLKTLFGPKHQYPIPTAPVIPESSLRQLQQLMYSKQSETAPQPIGTLPSKTMEAHLALAARESAAKLKKGQQIKANLSDVSLDD